MLLVDAVSGNFSITIHYSNTRGHQILLFGPVSLRQIKDSSSLAQYKKRANVDSKSKLTDKFNNDALNALALENQWYNHQIRKLPAYFTDQ